MHRPRLPLLSRGCAGLAVLASALASLNAAACPPQRTLSVVVPYSPGGSLDATTRIIAQAVSNKMERLIAVRNVPGASGVLGVREVLAAAPDGCTVLAGTVNTVVLVPLSNPSARFESSALRPVAKVGTAGLVLIASRHFGAETLQDLRAYARSRAEPLSAGHPGNDTVQALAIAMLEQRIGMGLIQVPYNGSAPLTNDLLGGHVHLAVVAMPVAQPLLEQGKIKVLASLTPEGGYPAESWSGWFVDARTPAASTSKLRSALIEALAEPKTARTLSELGAAPPPSSEQARFASRLHEDQIIYRQLVRRRPQAAK